uniref:TNFR-Cys domain-containing protein n=1 Tax=Pipistrellus kuhlii TaxID=59472 RepID=A0A7J7R8A4_PIPKU|nr:hypothetical protein mPipKuh1_010837 [Pipistrellus kuhlii]
MRSRPQLLLFPLLLPAWAASAAGSEPEPEPEPGDPNQRAATSPSDHLCEAGHYLTEDCYMGQARMCCPCPPGTFLSHPNKEASCRPCTPCRKDQEMVRDCTPTRDRQCQCKPGEFYCASGRCPETCYRCTSCPGATLRNCTATTDTVCAPGAPAQPGPSACSLALVVSVATLVIVVVAFIVAVAVAIACWRRGGVPLPQWLCRFTKPSVEPGSHGHILKTTDPESGLPAPNAETTQLLREASTLTPGAQTRPGPSADPDPDSDPDPDPDADPDPDPDTDPDPNPDTDLDPVLDPDPDPDTDPDPDPDTDPDPDPDPDTDLDPVLDPDPDTDPDPDPDTDLDPVLDPDPDPDPDTDPDPDPDPGAGVELQVEVEVEVEGGGREAPEPAPPSPAAAAPGALTWAEAAAGLRPPEQEHKCLFGEGHALTPPIGSLVNLDLRPQDGTRARAGRKEMAAGPVTFCALEPVAVL